MAAALIRFLGKKTQNLLSKNCCLLLRAAVIKGRLLIPFLRYNQRQIIQKKSLIGVKVISEESILFYVKNYLQKEMLPMTKMIMKMFQQRLKLKPFQRTMMNLFHIVLISHKSNISIFEEKKNNI